MIRLIAVLLCVLLPSVSFAQQGKVAVIKTGQKALYDGVLLDPTAYATIEADKLHATQLCGIEKQRTDQKCEAAQKFIIESHNNEKEIFKRGYDIQLEDKNKTITRLTISALESRPSRTLWFGIGAGVGIFLGAGIAIGVARSL